MRHASTGALALLLVVIALGGCVEEKAGGGPADGSQAALEDPTADLEARREIDDFCRKAAIELSRCEARLMGLRTTARLTENETLGAQVVAIEMAMDDAEAELDRVWASDTAHADSHVAQLTMLLEGLGTLIAEARLDARDIEEHVGTGS